MEEGRELPAGWFETSLGDLIDRIEAGKNFRCIERPPSTGEVGVVKVSAVSWGNFRQDESKTVPVGVELSPGSLIKKGDLLFSRANTIDLVGACVQVASIDKELHLSDKILRLVTTDESLKPWMHRFLSSPGARKHLSEASSGNQLSMRNISQKVLLETAIPLAPLNEQRRIAAKLDTTLAAVDACRQRLDGVEALLKRFRQAVLAAATSGELTREWREGKIEARNAWEQITLMQAIKRESAITYGVIKLGVEVSDGVPCLRTSNVRWLQIESDDVKRISPSISANYSRTVLAGGEVLVNVRGSLGGVAVVDTLMRGWNVSREIAVVPVDEARFIPEFLAFYIGSQKGQRWLAGVEKGVAYTGINLEDLRTLPVSRPTLEEQQEIVRRTQELFSLADQLEARLTAARRIVERLTPALLAKAFRGELVPQDPGDEPASALLERIRAARQAEAAAGQPSRRGRKKAAANPVPSPVDSAPVSPDQLANLLRECGALSERALLAASELDPASFQAQLAHERSLGAIGKVDDDGQELLEAVG
jgi:type I restriction enzyme S subunit